VSSKFPVAACVCVYRSELISATSGSPDLLTLPDTGARERVPVQPLPHPQTSNRDRPLAPSHRATDQDLVPEQAHEGQEGETADHGTERNGVVMATSIAAACCSGNAAR